MKRTRFVTFPRSGHHWLISLLQQRIPELVYDEHYSTGNTLETAPLVNAQKTHDFDLIVPKCEEFAHVVQIREITASIASWYKLTPVGSFEQFDAKKRRFRALWLEKWLVEPVPNRIVVRYEELLSDTEREVDRVANFLCR